MVRQDYPSFAEIELNLFHQNIDLIYRVAGRRKIIPVIKANAYGHGAVALSAELCKRNEVHTQAVGVLSEAAMLRKSGIAGRLMVLDGILPTQAKMAVELNLEPVISNLEEAKRLSRVAGKKKVSIHFKLNTGMSRLGADCQTAFDLYKKIIGIKKLRVVSIMTHFASSDCDKLFTNKQIAKFDDFCDSLSASGVDLPPKHAANTSGVFRHPSSHYDFVRPGLGLYGIQEFDGQNTGLSPILSWFARIIMIRDLKKGDPVSYNLTWTSSRKRKVAIAMVGYADGFNRALSNKWQAIINGVRIPQVGTICMDNCFFDVTGTEASIGDVITLIGTDGGKTVSAIKMARALDTIAYEVLCLIGARTTRFYLKSGRVVGAPSRIYQADKTFT